MPVSDSAGIRLQGAVAIEPPPLFSRADVSLNSGAVTGKKDLKQVAGAQTIMGRK